MQASRVDFYFSHRVWFFSQSVIYNKTDLGKDEQQRTANDNLRRALWAMIIEKITAEERSEQANLIDPNKQSYVFLQNEASSERFESLFLSNSFDLIELLV